MAYDRADLDNKYDEGYSEGYHNGVEETAEFIKKPAKPATNGIWYAGAAAAAIFGAYQVNQLKKFYDLLQTSASVSDVTVAGTSLIINLVVKVSNPSKVSMKIRTPFVMLFSSLDEVVPFAHSSAAIRPKITIEPYKSVTIPIKVEMALGSVLVAVKMMKKYFSDDKIKLTVKAETEVVLLWGLLKFYKKDLIEMPFQRKKEAAPQPVVEAQAAIAEETEERESAHAQTLLPEKTTTNVFSNCKCGVGGIGI